MNKIFTDQPYLRSVLGVATLIVGLGVSPVYASASDSSEPQAHSDNLGAAISDTAITAKVKFNIMDEDGLKHSDIDVSTTNGVVTLSGHASSPKAKSMAGKVAKSVEGVKSVDNTLRTPGSSEKIAKAERVISDSWITTKVKSHLLADSVSKGLNVDVTTVHGVVVLKGELANQDAIDHVKDLASQVEGVKSVDVSALTVAAK